MDADGVALDADGVARLLRNIGLEQYEPGFREEGVDGLLLLDMVDNKYLREIVDNNFHQGKIRTAVVKMQQISKKIESDGVARVVTKKRPTPATGVASPKRASTADHYWRSVAYGEGGFVDVAWEDERMDALGAGSKRWED